MTFVIILLFLFVSLLLVWYLINRDKGPREPVNALWISFAFGILSLAITSGVVYLKGDFFESSSNLLMILASSLVVGFTEEISKFIPLALFIYKKKYFNEHSDGILYFVIVGLTFGFIENFFYTLAFGSGIGLTRLILLPIFHGASTGIVGYFLARKKATNGSKRMVILALCTVSIVHGMYNFGMTSELPLFGLISLMLTVLIAVGLFLFHSEAHSKDRENGVSALGANRYCNVCGKKNINKSLFCIYCGKRF